jgi:hypothetical protein
LRSSAQWPSLNAVLADLAADARRGDLPRAFLGEQNYWTLVGVDGGGERSALLSEDGALEVGRGGFSVDPAVMLDDGTQVTWADGTLSQSLREGYLPLPAVHWRHAAFDLDIEAAADGPRDAPALLARYTLRNTGERERTFTLVLAVRPWQVNPPQQFLATHGGVSPIRTLSWSASGLMVNRRATLQPTVPPRRVTALPFDGGLSVSALRAAPGLTRLEDPQHHASAALEFRITLPAGAVAVLGWTSPLGGQGTPAPPAAGVQAGVAGSARAIDGGSTPSADGVDDAPAMRSDTSDTSDTQLDARFAAVAAHWRERLNRATLRVPAQAQPVVDTLRTSLAHILLSRDGPALRPATRSYARTWVRDGAMMVAGLVRMGEADAAREFVDWFAGHIFESGKVPCCVDRRGADPVVENDSHGQYLYAVAELWRHTRDRAFVERHWPHVRRVVAYMEGLRQSERGEANRTPERAHLFGLMPPSISHEGYSDKAAYSYWDDFWTLRGYKDAVAIANALGREPEAREWGRQRDEFERELNASIETTAKRHDIGFVAGAADRGDFDATSTTMALSPAQASVPPQLLAATFERYWDASRARAEGRKQWTDYTPYELRTVGAFVRLGQPARAHAMLRWFFEHQRPPGWNQWAEVVLPDARRVRFLGDMPHAWVSSDYIRSVLDLFAYERDADDAVVIGAGLQLSWLREGVQVHGLSTPHGRLDYTLAIAPGGWTLQLRSALQGLSGGIRLAWPGDGPLPRATVDDRPLEWQGRELLVPSTPAVVQLALD